MKNLRPVYIVGTGMTPVAEHWERSLAGLAHQALRAALAPLGGRALDALYVGNALGGELTGQSQLGAALAGSLGLAPLEALRIEAAEASGAAALRMGALAIASGAADLVAVVGVEKASDLLEERVEAGLAQAADADNEAAHGLTRAGQWAMLMRRYLHQYGYDDDALAPFPINAHANAHGNPNALYRFAIDAKRYRSAPPVAAPIRLLDAPTIADGAAAVVLAAGGLAQELALEHPPVRIAASALATDTLALHARRDPLWLAAAERSAGLAFAQAGLSHADINVLEISDPHGITTALALEASGFAGRGEAAALAREGAIRPDGQLPLATFGGCKARGDVLGATGVYQIVELTHQLQQRAASTQVAGARAAFALSLGGIGSTAVTHILVRD